ncbi:MAG: substrate-binding domain-containing protein [Opitutaceae bacterium]
MHSQIRQSLRTIIENEFEDGQRFYTERELVKQLGAALLTVRRALGDLVAEGLLERSVGRGSFVRKGGALKSIGVFVPDYSSSVFIQFLEELSGVARTARARLNVYHTHQGESVAEALSQMKSTPQEEAVMLVGNMNEVNLHLHAHLLERGFRVALVNNFIPGLPVASIGMNDGQAIAAGFEHLMALGHTRILFLVSEPLEGAGVRQKHDAAVAYMKAKRLRAARVLICGTAPFEDSYAAACRRMPEIWAAADRPTAIFAVSDAGALGVLRYAYEQRVAVPRELSVLAINNSPAGRFANPALTSVALPLKKIAEKAVQLLSRNELSPRAHLFPGELIERESTGPAPR